jgi:5'-3' exonuclease
LIGAYGHLEQIPALAHNWKIAPRGALQLATTLAEHRDEAFLYRKLATLIDTVPLNDSLDDLKYRGVPREPFERWCHALGAQRLLATPRRWQ